MENELDATINRLKTMCRALEILAQSDTMAMTITGAGVAQDIDTVLSALVVFRARAQMRARQAERLEQELASRIDLTGWRATRIDATTIEVFNPEGEGCPVSIGEHGDLPGDLPDVMLYRIGERLIIAGQTISVKGETR
jgi:hypothetical protein